MRYETLKGCRRCYAADFFQEEMYNPCGHSRFEAGKWWCTLGGGTGKLEGYVGFCGNINPWPEENQQMTFEELLKGEQK